MWYEDYSWKKACLRHQIDKSGKGRTYLWDVSTSTWKAQERGMCKKRRLGSATLSWDLALCNIAFGNAFRLIVNETLISDSMFLNENHDNLQLIGFMLLKMKIISSKISIEI